MKYGLTSLLMVLSASSLSGCAYLTDSSFGPNDEPRIKVQSAAAGNSKQVKAKPSAKSGKNSGSVALESQSQPAFSFVPQDSVVVESYVPNGSLTQNADAYPSNGIPLTPNASEESSKVDGNLNAASQAPRTYDQSAEIIDAVNASNVAELKDQSVAVNSSCSLNLNDQASALALEMSAGLAAKLKGTSGDIYVAPTVIEDEYADCVGDLSAAVKQGLKNSTFSSVEGRVVSVAQNSGSSIIIPSLIRSCRSSGIPYLNVSIVKKASGKPELNIKVVRVKDGVTIAQSSKRLTVK